MADLIVLAGNVAIEFHGTQTYGFGGGRADVWEPEEDVYWGPEWASGLPITLHRPAPTRQLLAPCRWATIEQIPRPNGNFCIHWLRPSIWRTSARMAMNDEETKGTDCRRPHLRSIAHGAADPEQIRWSELEGASIEEQGLGWKHAGTGKGVDTISSGLEGAWTKNPAATTIIWGRTCHSTTGIRLKSFRRRVTVGGQGDYSCGTVPDAHDPKKARRRLCL